MNIKIYLWNAKELAKELGQDRISEKICMHYFLASCLLVLIVTYYSLFWDQIRNWLFYSEVIIVSVITIFGCLEIFKANSSNEGRDFVKRAICLSVPVGVRVNVLSGIFGLFLNLTATHIFTATLFGDPLRAATLVFYAALVGFNIYYWWLLVQGFKQVQKYEKNPGINHVN